MSVIKLDIDEIIKKRKEDQEYLRKEQEDLIFSIIFNISRSINTLISPVWAGETNFINNFCFALLKAIQEDSITWIDNYKTFHDLINRIFYIINKEYEGVRLIDTDIGMGEYFTMLDAIIKRVIQFMNLKKNNFK